MDELISINGEVAQGKLCSPMLFNIYFVDHLDKLNQICHASLAYADDLVLICRSDDDLTQGIKALRDWCNLNEIQVNDKKSWILILNSNKKDADSIYFIN